MIEMQNFEDVFEEEEEEEGNWLMTARLEILEYLLRRYGNLRAKDIADILGCKVRSVQPLLKKLEHSGRVKCLKLGKNSVWTLNEYGYETIYY